MTGLLRRGSALAAGLVVLLAALFLAPYPARAETSGPHGTPLKACIARAVPGVPLARVFASPPAFDCVKRQAAHGPGDYWVRLDGVRNAPHEEMSLRMASLWQGGATVAIRYADGRIFEHRADSGALWRHVEIGAIVDFAVPRRNVPATDILMRIDGAANLRGVIVAPRLETRAQTESTALWMTALYAGFAGLAFALLVYNFVLWLTLRYRFQLQYCLMIVGTMGYTFTASAAVFELFPGLDNNDRLRINYLLLALTCVAGVQFCAAFFGKETVGRRLQWLIHGASAFLLVTGSAFALFAPSAIWWLDRTYFASFAVALALLPALTWRAYIAKSRFLGMFLFAWSVPVVVTFLRIIYGFGLIPYSFWLDNGTVVSMSVESLLNSLAIAFRIRMLVEERDREKAEKAVAEALASTDPLTGLDNRRAFLAAALLRDGPQRLMLVDIDHFKRVNDTMGHDAGDDVLRAFALALRKWAPEGALVARLGGEEFGLMVAAKTGGSADTVLSAIRAQAMPSNRPVTASIGVAEGVIATEEDWRAIYRRADVALYRAKSDGRDRACLSTPLPQAA